MTRPRLLDLFAGGQGAGVGYARAGFEVHAVDIEPHDRHPEIASFTVADAMDVLADVAFCRGFAVIHASPVCKGYTPLSALLSENEYALMIQPVREALIRVGGPYVIENVPAARWDMRGPLELCGASFGLGAICRDSVYRPLRRHRLFESPQLLMASGCACDWRQPLGVYGTGGGGQMTRGYKARLAEAKAAMGIDWMTVDDMSQAIPPAYTQFIGEQLLDALAGQDLPHPVPGQPADGRDLLLGDAVRGEHPHRLMQRGPGAAVVPQGAAGGVGGHGSGPDVEDQREVAVLVTASAEVDPHPHGVGTEQLGDGQSAADVAVGLVGGERAGDRLRHADESALLVGTLSTTSRQVAS